MHLREGNSNTRFFHRMANSNRRNNGIENLLVNRSLSSNQDMIPNCITQFFMNLYYEQQFDQPFPNLLDLLTIFEDKAD